MNPMMSLLTNIDGRIHKFLALVSLPFGEIVVGGNRTILRPMIHPMRVLTKDILDFLNARMTRLTVHHPTGVAC